MTEGETCLLVPENNHFIQHSKDRYDAAMKGTYTTVVLLQSVPSNRSRESKCLFTF